MEPEGSPDLSDNTQTLASPSPSKDRHFLRKLEAYLARRDGVDKVLKISRYASKLILSSSLLPDQNPLNRRLKSFESSVGISRKAFRLGKFVQDINALRDSASDSALSVLAHGGEGLYYFIEQFIWLARSGLIDGKHTRILQRISAWAEFIGYFGSVSLKIRDLKKLSEDEACVLSKISGLSGVEMAEELRRLEKVREKKILKRLSVVQDMADGLMAFADIREGKGRLSEPFILSCAGLLSAIIGTHKNWVSS